MIASATSNMAQYNEAIEGGYRPRMSSHSLEKQAIRGLASHNKLANQSIVEDDVAPVRVVTVKAGHLPPNPRAHPRQTGLHQHLMQSLGPTQESQNKQGLQDSNKYAKRISDSDQQPNEPFQQRLSDAEFKDRFKDRKNLAAQAIPHNRHWNPRDRYTSNNQPGSTAFMMHKPGLFNLEASTPFEIGLDCADYPEDIEANPENLLCLENDRNSEEERSLLINDYNSRKKPQTRLSSDVDQYYQSQADDRANNSRHPSKKSRNNINTVDIYTKNSEGEKQIQKFLIPDKAQGITDSFALLSDEESPADRDHSESPRQGIRFQERDVRRQMIGKEKANHLNQIEKPRGSGKNSVKQTLKQSNATVTKKTQIHLSSPTRVTQNYSRKPTDKQISQREKDKQIAKVSQHKLQLSKKGFQTQPKDTKGIIKTINEHSKHKNLINTPSSKILRGAHNQRNHKNLRTSEKKVEQKTYIDIPNLNFQDMDADQLPEVHVEEEEFIDTDHARPNAYTQGGSIKPQTTRNMKQSSFVENQVLKSQSNYSEWLNSQRDSRLKGSYHEKLKLDDLNHESKNSSLKKKTMQTGGKIKQHPKIESQTASKRQQIIGSGIASMPSFVKVAQQKPKKPQLESGNLKGLQKSQKQAPKSNHPSFIQGTGSSKQILSSNENTHLSSGQLSGRKVVPKKMLGKVVKTSKLDLDPIKRKETQLSSTQQIPSKKLESHSKLPGSSRLATDLVAKKASEKSFKKTGLATSTPLGSPSLVHPQLVPNKPNAHRQNPYATVHSVMSTGIQNSASSIKKNTIHSKGQAVAGRSSMIDAKHQANMNRQKAIQGQLSGNSFTVTKKDISTRKAKLSKKDPALLASVCVADQGQYQTQPTIRNEKGFRSPIYRGKQLERVDEHDFKQITDQYHYCRVSQEQKREYKSQQRHQTPSLLEKQKRELKLELERQMKFQRQQHSGSDIGPRSKNSHSKEVSGGSKNHSLQRVKFQQEHDMIYQTLDSPTSTPRRERQFDGKKRAQKIGKDGRLPQAIQPFKQNVHQLLDLLQKACETPPGPIQEARGLDKFERIDQQYKMQEEFNSVVHQIKAQFKAEIRK